MVRREKKRQDCKPRTQAIRSRNFTSKCRRCPAVASRIAARFAQSALLLGREGSQNVTLVLGLHSVRLKSRKVATLAVNLESRESSRPYEPFIAVDGT